jgi:hypothetical protein
MKCGTASAALAVLFTSYLRFPPVLASFIALLVQRFRLAYLDAAKYSHRVVF